MTGILSSKDWQAGEGAGVELSGGEQDGFKARADVGVDEQGGTGAMGSGRTAAV
jgi:hypothetical protein